MFLRKIALPLAAALCAQAAFAQGEESYEVSKNEYGQPDLQGVWSARFYTPLERPDGMPLELSPEQAQGFLAAAALGDDVNTDPDISILGAPQLATVRGVPRSSVLTSPENGKLPYNEAGARRSAHGYFLGRGYDGPEQRPGVERCTEAWASPPMGAMMYKIYHGFVQTPDSIAIVSEEASQVRVIHLGENTRPPAVTGFDGYSVGRFDGDALVVETTHFSDVNPERATIGRPMLLSSAAKVTERFSKISEDELLYQFTVEDPTYYTEAFEGEFSFVREDVNHIYEYACHEGNYSMVGALRGARVQEADAAAEQQ